MPATSSASTAASRSKLAPTSSANRSIPKPTSTSSSTTRKAAAPAPSQEMDVDGNDDGDDDLEDMAPADRISHLQRTVSRLTRERDALSNSLNEIQSLRSTTAESALASYKKATEAKLKHSAELASSLRARLRAAGGTGAEEDKAEDDAMERLREELEREKRHRREAQEKAKRLEHDLQRASSSSSSAARSTAAPVGKGTLNDADNRAVRRLYEDLTGIVVSRVDVVHGDDDEADERRKFTGVFTATGHHDLQLTLEESSSSLPSATSTSSSSSRREDLIFFPHLDPHRDAALVESTTLPAYLRDEIRFDRALSLKFLTSLTKGLKK